MVVIVYVSVQPAQLDTPLNCFLVCLRKGSVSVQFHACFHGKSAVFDRLIQLLASSKLGTGRHMLIFAIKVPTRVSLGRCAHLHKIIAALVNLFLEFRVVSFEFCCASEGCNDTKPNPPNLTHARADVDPRTLTLTYCG